MFSKVIDDCPDLLEEFRISENCTKRATELQRYPYTKKTIIFVAYYLKNAQLLEMVF